MASDVIYDAVLGALTLLQVERGSFTFNEQKIDGTMSGGLDVSEYYGGTSDPRATFSTTDIGGVISAVSAVAGLAVAAGTISIPFQKRSNQSTFAGSTSHEKVTAANGLIIPVRASASQDGEASFDLETIIRSTDGLNPVTISTGQSLSSQSFNAHWTLGPVTVNGTTIEEAISATINYGITVEVKRYEGLNFPKKINIVQRRPTIDLTFHDFAELQGFAAAHTVMTAAVVKFRKRSGAGFVANGTSGHASFSFGDGLIGLQTVEAANSQDGTATVRLYGETLSHTLTTIS